MSELESGKYKVWISKPEGEKFSLSAENDDRKGLIKLVLELEDGNLKSVKGKSFRQGEEENVKFDLSPLTSLHQNLIGDGTLLARLRGIRDNIPKSDIKVMLKGWNFSLRLEGEEKIIFFLLLQIVVFLVLVHLSHQSVIWDQGWLPIKFRFPKINGFIDKNLIKTLAIYLAYVNGLEEESAFYFLLTIPYNIVKFWSFGWKISQEIDFDLIHPYLNLGLFRSLETRKDVLLTLKDEEETSFNESYLLEEDCLFHHQSAEFERYLHQARLSLLSQLDHARQDLIEDATQDVRQRLDGCLTETVNRLYPIFEKRLYHAFEKLLSECRGLGSSTLLGYQRLEEVTGQMRAYEMKMKALEEKINFLLKNK